MEEIKIINYRIIRKDKSSLIMRDKFNIFGINSIARDKNYNKRIIFYKFIINYFLKLICAYLSILYLYLLKEYYLQKKQHNQEQNHRRNETLQYHNKNETQQYYHHYKFSNINNSTNYQYFSCFVGLGREENKYIREFIEYYLKLGVEKFILGDNNLPNKEKFSDVIQDYIKDGFIDIIELFGSTIGQSELYQMVYDKYKTKCNWFLLFDFDEYLEIFFEKGKNLILKNYLTHKIFDKCESILFNWVIYSDNDLIYYDNRTLVERFTTPNFRERDNIYVKSIVRGGLNKTIFLPNKSNHIPEKNLTICNSKGNIININNSFAISPPIFDNGYLKHFVTKTAEEFCEKIIRGHPRNVGFNPKERIKLFFNYNKFSKEKLKIFEKKFNRIFRIKKRNKNYFHYKNKGRLKLYLYILFIFLVILLITNYLLFS